MFFFSKSVNFNRSLRALLILLHFHCTSTACILKCKILIFFNCHGCRLFFWDLRLISPAFFKHNNWFLATVHYKVYILFCIIWNYSWALYRANCLESGYFLEDWYQFWGILTRWLFSPKKHIKNVTEIWPSLAIEIIFKSHEPFQS